jgi:hypothetical protein
MLLHARGFAFVLLAAITLSSCSGGFGTTTPAAPQSGIATDSDASSADGAPALSKTVTDALDSAPLVSVPARAIFKPLNLHPSKAMPPILMGFVAAGAAQGGVPCISCVNGASNGDNIGLAGPINYVYKNATWQYSIAYTDLTYTGNCVVAWAITAGDKKIDAFSAKLKLTQAGGLVLYGLNRNFPKYAGNATLTGRVSCGKNRLSAQVPLVFQ